jgi:hypothetical protein
MVDAEDMRVGKAYFRRGDVGCAALSGRWHLDKTALKQMLLWDERDLLQWEGLCSREPGMLLNVPPLRESGSQYRSFWGFRNPVVSDTVSVECVMYFTRRGTPATEKELKALVALHMETDGAFLLSVMQRIFTREVSNLLPILEASVRRLYLMHNAAPEELLRSRKCVKCGKLGRHKQCGCKTQVFYCSKRCQMADWFRHREECAARGAAGDSAGGAAGGAP